jgi:hypothetical protein
MSILACPDKNCLRSRGESCRSLFPEPVLKKTGWLHSVESGLLVNAMIDPVMVTKRE